MLFAHGNKIPHFDNLFYKPVATAEDDAFMADLLGEVDTNVVSNHAPTRNIVKSGARRKVRVLSPPLSEKRRRDKLHARDENDMPSSPVKDQALHSDDLDDGPLPMPDDDDVCLSDILPSSPTSKAVEQRNIVPVKAEEPEDDDVDLMDVAEDTEDSSLKSKTINMTGSRPPPKIKHDIASTPASSSPIKSMPEVMDASWNDVRSKLNVLSSPAPEMRSFGKLRAQDVVEEDGSLRMFWLDYTEVNGSLCLFGKVKNKQNGSYTSAFVKVWLL